MIDDFNINLMSILNRKRKFPETIEQNGIVFRFSQERSTHDSALNEAYFARKKGYYARIIKRKGVYGVYLAKKH